MNKITKKILRSLLLGSVMSLMHTSAKAEDSKLPSLDFNEDDKNKVDALKHSVLNNVIRLSPSGRLSTINGHRSHSSHRSHYSSRGGHSSHSSHSSHYSSSHTSHYSSSHTSHYSSTPSSSYSNTSRATGLYSSTGSSTPAKTATKTPADYSLGDRTIKSGVYGADVDQLAQLLTTKYYMKESAVAKKSDYSLFDYNMASAVKHFQKDAGLTETGIVDENTLAALRQWNASKTSIELGFRDVTDGVSGMDVTLLVKLLTAAGFPPESSKIEYKDGNVVFNSEVTTALKMFQAYNKLQVSGNLDTPTITKLKTYSK